MCQYFGGKIRIGKYIYDAIEHVEICIQGDISPLYFEPFLGMGGVFRHFAEEGNRVCIGCDSNSDLMLMWEGLHDGWEPPRNVDFNTHQISKHEPPSATRTFIGFGSSYMGRFFSGYTDTCRKSYNRVMSIRDTVMMDSNVFMGSSDYSTHDPYGMTIYCDPPYMESGLSNNLIRHFDNFDADSFWERMRLWSKNNIVLISETSSPSDFFPVWEKQVGRNFYKESGFFNGKSGRTEKLFLHETYRKYTHKGIVNSKDRMGLIKQR